MCLNVEPKASFNCAVFPPLIFNGRHSHLRTLEADIKGWILPPILTLVCIKLSGSSASQGGCLCGGVRPVMCRGGRTRNTAYYGSGEGCGISYIFQNMFTEVVFTCNPVSSDAVGEWGKGGEIVSPSLFLLHTNKCSYR